MHIRHAIKTGIACTIAFWVSQMLDSPYGVWAVISTVIAMQGISVADSLQTSLIRLTGMGTGAVCGMVLLLFAPRDPILLGIELFLVTALGSYMVRYGKRYIMATTAACLVLLAGQADGGETYREMLTFGMLLVLEVSIGVASALLVTALIWPVRLKDTLVKNISKQLVVCGNLLHEVIDAYLNGQSHLPGQLLEGVYGQSWSNHAQLDMIRKTEMHIFHYSKKELKLQVQIIDRCVEGLRALLDALNEYDEAPSDPLLGAEIKTLGNSLGEALNALAAGNTVELAPSCIRKLTGSIYDAEVKLVALRGAPEFKKLPLHRALQLYTFYQSLRMLTEDVLVALYEVQLLQQGRSTPKGIGAA